MTCQKMSAARRLASDLPDYDPEIARFISPDPVHFKEQNPFSFNRYAYTANNPLTRIDPTGKDWVFSQSSGQWSHVNNQTGLQISIGLRGYSGTGQGRNNPAMQNVPHVGPIPRGTYDIGAPYYNRHTGPMTMNLLPRPGTNTFGRNLFRIHGDNPRHDASEGCPIASRSIREQISNSGDWVLRVEP